MDMHPQEQQIQFYQMGVFNCSKTCLQHSKIIFQSALIFKVLQDPYERLQVLRSLFAYGYGYSSNRLIQFYQVGVFYCSQACLKYFKIMDYINTRYTRQSKKINLILLYPYKHCQQQQIDIVFSIGCSGTPRIVYLVKFLFLKVI